MREWVKAYNLPVFTVVTKIDYLSGNKRSGIINTVKKDFGGDVLAFSSEDNRYNEQLIEYLTDLCN